MDCTGFVCLSLSAACALAQPITIDSRFDDWAGVPIAATDPAGDATGAFDITEVSAITRGTTIYLAWDTNAGVNLQAGNGPDGTIRIELGFESADTLTIDLRLRLAYRNGNIGDGVPWHDINYATMPTVALPRYETRVDVADFAAAGETVAVQFSGTDSLDAGPILLTLDQPPEPPTLQSLDRETCTDFRVFNLNTLNGGLTAGGRRDKIARMITSFNPEIICLQEEGGGSTATIKSRLESVDSSGNGQPWNVHREADDVIASQYAVIPVNTGDRFAAAVVELPAGAVFVVSVHTKCCGYAGDSADNQRVASMNNLAGIIADLRAETLSSAMDPFADAPIVAVGDWNHVGSNTPLEIMLNPAGPALTHWIAPRTAAGDAATWRDTDGFGFSPGLLDIVAFDDARLDARNGFVLDTSRLDPTTLAAQGLLADDSEASDHLAIVSDFTFPNSADINGDGELDFFDVGDFLSLFNAGNPAADLSGDGVIDFFDVSAFLAAFQTGCP